jgi:Spy/CpxP family protein refolding chaperone
MNERKASPGNRFRWTVVLAGTVALGLCVGPAFAEPGGGFGGPRVGRGSGLYMSLPLLVKGVGLTEAQQAQVKQIVGAHQAQFRALLGQLRSGHEQLREKIYAPGPLQAEDVAPLVQQIGQLRGQLTQEALQVALEIRAVLTPEQLARAEEIQRKLKDLRSEMRSLLGRDQ